VEKRRRRWGSTAAATTDTKLVSTDTIKKLIPAEAVEKAKEMEGQQKKREEQVEASSTQKPTAITIEQNTTHPGNADDQPTSS
jgi:hypothetical protein